MKTAVVLHHLLLQLFLASTFHQLAHSVNSTNSSYYYNQCAPSTCGASILKYPFGKNPLCRGAYIKPSCENNSVFLLDEQNPYIKYQLLENLTEQVYSSKSLRLVDTSLYGCGTIPSYHAATPDSENQSQKWQEIGAFTSRYDIRPGTFLNCTKEVRNGTLAKLMKAPCLECRKTSNFCYFYDGYIEHVDNCRSLRVNVPINQIGNFSGNLRKILQKGFVVQWKEDCKLCMQNDVGRCGYLNPESKSGDEYCFCSDGIHKNNCNDGVVLSVNATGSIPLKHPSKSRIGMILGITIGGVVTCLCASYIFYKRRHKMKQDRLKGKRNQALKDYLDGDNITVPTSVETFLKNYTSGRPTRFSYKQLKKYTNNFNHKIGQGGFGSVFKGQLPNGFSVAIKILDESTNQIETQFLNEVLTIGRIHHNHLVRLLGYCLDHSRIALIYEFMVNGSLEKYIHEKKHKVATSTAQSVTEKLILTWSQLHDIAIGTAEGLAYLHEECRNRILHCDIKPHNILLDENLQPKVSDFGLAMALNKDSSRRSVKHGAGTPGYAPPEMWFEKLGPVTDKSDVYSFGMVLLEMAGKRRNFDVDASKSSEVYFPHWVYSHHVEKAYCGGGSKWHECEGKEEEEMATRMELVGLWCIQFEPSKRPSMRKVVDMLEENVAIDIPPPHLMPCHLSDLKVKSKSHQNDKLA